jgi:ribonuclease E
MMDVKNRKAVENVLRDAFADDRAKIQIGRISSFGLLEMSRQRMRASFLEINTKICHVCAGSGAVKATESIAINVLRAIEDEVSRGQKCKAVDVHVSTEVAIYILNNKRRQLSAIEDRYNVRVFISADSSIVGELWRINKLNIPQNEITEPAQDDVHSNHRGQASRENILNEKPRRGRKRNEESVGEKQESRQLSQHATVGSILSGLWKKIID